MKKFKKPLKLSYPRKKEKELAACSGFWQDILAWLRIQNLINVQSLNYATMETSQKKVVGFFIYSSAGIP